MLSAAQSALHPPSRPGGHPDPGEPLHGLGAPLKGLLVKCAARELRARIRRGQFFRARLIGDAPWDILLALYVLGSRQPHVSSAHLMRICAIPRSSALRWMRFLQDRKLVVRRSPHDARGPCLALTDKARMSLDRYFSNTPRRGP